MIRLPVRSRTVIGAAALVVVGAIAGAVVVTSGGGVSPVPRPAPVQTPTAAGVFGAVGTAEAVPCPGSLAAGAAFVAAKEVEGTTYDCGVVVVPENHDKPSGRTIELFYLRLRSSGSPASSAAPMVYLAGGPGSSGSTELSVNPLLHQNLDRVRRSRDLIAYDQRGTGYSNYLLCAPFESALGVLQARDPQVAATIKKLQETESGVGYGALRANLCGVGTKLLAGVDPSQYNSVASARDIPMLVRALGYTGGYSLYGTSYGTRLAQYAMRSVPEGIQGVILDGVVGPAIPNAMWSSTKFVGSYVAVFDQCAADEACNAAYPNLADRFGALLQRLEKKPLVFDPPMVVNPPLTVILPPVLKQIDAEFFRKLAELDNLALGGGFASSIPRLILAVEQEDVEFFRTSSLSASASAANNTPPTVPQGEDVRTPGFRAEQPLFEVPFRTLLSLAQTSAAHAQASVDTQWLSVVLGDLAARLQSGEKQDDLMQALLRLSVVPNTGTTAAVLTAFSQGNLSPSGRTAADAVAGRMTRNDVRATLWSIQDVAMTLGTVPDQRGYSNGMMAAVNCADEINFTSLDQAKADVAKTRYPQLVAFPIDFNVQQLASCLSYPSPLPRSVTDPLVSDIPTLLYLSQLDTETPVDWGRSVAGGLKRATLVEWRNLGHVAAARDPKFCAGDVADAFLSDPTQAPDVTCTLTDDYKLTFALE